MLARMPPTLRWPLSWICRCRSAGQEQCLRSRQMPGAARPDCLGGSPASTSHQPSWATVSCQQVKRSGLHPLTMPRLAAAAMNSFSRSALEGMVKGTFMRERTAAGTGEQSSKLCV